MELENQRSVARGECNTTVFQATIGTPKIPSNGPTKGYQAPRKPCSTNKTETIGQMTPNQLRFSSASSSTIEAKKPPLQKRKKKVQALLPAKVSKPSFEFDNAVNDAASDFSFVGLDFEGEPKPSTKSPVVGKASIPPPSDGSTIDLVEYKVPEKEKATTKKKEVTSITKASYPKAPQKSKAKAPKKRAIRKPKEPQPKDLSSTDSDGEWSSATTKANKSKIDQSSMDLDFNMASPQKTKKAAPKKQPNPKTKKQKPDLSSMELDFCDVDDPKTNPIKTKKKTPAPKKQQKPKPKQQRPDLYSMELQLSDLEDENAIATNMTTPAPKKQDLDSMELELSDPDEPQANPNTKTPAPKKQKPKSKKQQQPGLSLMELQLSDIEEENVNPNTKTPAPKKQKPKSKKQQQPDLYSMELQLSDIEEPQANPNTKTPAPKKQKPKSKKQQQPGLSLMELQLSDIEEENVNPNTKTPAPKKQKPKKKQQSDPSLMELQLSDLENATKSQKKTMAPKKQKPKDKKRQYDHSSMDLELSDIDPPTEKTKEVDFDLVPLKKKMITAPKQQKRQLDFSSMDLSDIEVRDQMDLELTDLADLDFIKHKTKTKKRCMDTTPKQRESPVENYSRAPRKSKSMDQSIVATPYQLKFTHVRESTTRKRIPIEIFKDEEAGTDEPSSSYEDEDLSVEHRQVSDQLKHTIDRILSIQKTHHQRQIHSLKDVLLRSCEESMSNVLSQWKDQLSLERLTEECTLRTEKTTESVHATHQHQQVLAYCLNHQQEINVDSTMIQMESYSIDPLKKNLKSIESKRFEQVKSKLAVLHSRYENSSQLFSKF